jgi:hypothetical protein
VDQTHTGEHALRIESPHVVLHRQNGISVREKDGVNDFGE